MSGYAAAAVATLKLVQAVLVSLQAYLAIGTYLCPTVPTIDTVLSNSPYTHIIAGSGSAGSILAARLAELTTTKVLVIEAGGCPPFESYLAGYFTMLPMSNYDYGYNLYNDGVTLQNTQSQGGATIGKMIGGGGSIEHMMRIPPTKEDFDYWAAAAGDSSWGFPDILQFFSKGTKVTDEGILAQNQSWIGKNGETLLKRQESSLMEGPIAGHVELGLPYKNDSDGLCVNSPLFAIGDNIRQCGNVAYVSKIKNNNVTFLTNAEVTKVIFDGTKATGVQFTYGGSTYTVSASHEVILSAGAIKSPQILMLSGVGNSTALSELGIDVVVNNSEVGNNLMDHVSACFCVSVANATASSILDPHMFPVPMITSYDALDRTQHQPELQTIMLYFSANSTGLLQLTAYGFKFLYSICDTWYQKNMKSDTIMFIPNLLHTLSKGSILLNSTNVTDQPIINPGYLSNSADLNTFAELLLQYVEPLLTSSAFQALGAEFIDLDFCTDTTRFSLDYWKCYIKEMSATMWHYSGTCAMGKVVDNKLNVYGTTHLKVIDASIMPYLPSGNIGFAVQALAEKGADILKSEFST